MSHTLKLNRTLGLLLVIGGFILTGCGISDIQLAQSANASSDVTSPVVTEAARTEDREEADARDLIAEDQILVALQDTLTSIYERVNPSIVSVQVRKRTQREQLPMGNPPSPEGVGSGFIWDEQGHIVTNNHVIEDAQEVQVRFHDGFVADAEITGTDPDSDLAVLKVDVDSERLAPVSVTNSDSLKVGELAIALGSPFGLENTMTVGFISAIGRSLPAAASRYTIPRIIQTDAAINPGNSGGALVNHRGEVVGVNTAIVSPSRASAGVGFAIPSSLVIEIVPALIEDGEYDHAWLGISGITLTNDMAAELGLANEQQGVLITGVVLDGPAEQAGLKGTQRDVDANESQMPVGGDVIVALEGKPIRDFEDLVSELVGYQAGETVDLGIIRDGENLTIPVTLSARPEDLLNQERTQQEPEPRAPASAWLGIVGRDVGEVIIDRMALDQDQVGVLVEAVAPNSPAAEAGLEGGSERTLIEGSIVVLGGDIIVSWSDRSIETFEDLRQSLADADPGDTVEIGVLRDGEMRTLEITLGER